MTDMLEPPADRIEAAAEALKFDEEDGEVAKEEQAETETETEESGEEETSESEEGDESASDDSGDGEVSSEETSETEPEKKEDDEPPNWKWQQLRKREKQLREYEDRLEARMTDFEQRAARIAKMERLLNEDPEAFASEVGDPDSVYDKWTNRRLNDGKPSEQELWQEIQGLKRELRERDERAKQRQIEFEEQSRQVRVESAINEYVSKADSIPDDEELSSQFPALAITHPNRRRPMVAGAIRWALENSPEMSFNEILKHLDKNLQEEYDYITKSRTTGAQEKSPEAKGAAKPAAKRKKTVTNKDEAATSVDFKPMTRDQRIAAAARELPDFLPGKK